MPNAAPMRSPSSDSSSVVARWRHNDPSAIQALMRRAIARGWLTKNGSSRPAATSDCQSERKTTATTTCQKTTAARRSAMRRLHPTLTAKDFSPQYGPDRPVNLHEPRLRPQFHQIAGPLERYRMARYHTARRPGREHDDFVGERDRLLQIVRDEDDGLLRRVPQREQLACHALARVHVERAERLVHQHDS